MQSATFKFAMIQFVSPTIFFLIFIFFTFSLDDWSPEEFKTKVMKILWGNKLRYGERESR